MTQEKTSCFVTTIDLRLADKLQSDLAEQGFTLKTPAYTIFAAQKKGVSCTLYTSGKLTVQGKEMAEFITFYLEPEILQSVAYSYPETQVDLKSHIGIDESGKGDFFGPLCIAGVYATELQIKELLAIGVKDSKTIPDTSIRKLSKKIQAICPFSIVYLSPKKYNELYQNFRNLNRLLAWGHATAIGELVAKTGCTDVVIDQFASEDVVIKALKQKALSVSLTQRHKAEADPVVAAASILARASFVEGLERLGKPFEVELPKGASPLVKKMGTLLVRKYGSGILNDVAKLHFKTTQEILHDQAPDSQ
ncbi:MAG: ribonuclease HIII [Verrucomicrobia bacterium]|nr:ribonuclease HIII [Verrucomicrobiota bacterium]